MNDQQKAFMASYEALKSYYQFIKGKDPKVISKLGSVNAPSDALLGLQRYDLRILGQSLKRECSIPNLQGKEAFKLNIDFSNCTHAQWYLD